MSKKSKKGQRERRKTAKANAKATRRALYAAWAEEGKNKKSKRSVKKGKRILVRSSKHPDIVCGNPGCKRCFPRLNEEYLGMKSKRVWIPKGRSK